MDKIKPYSNDTPLHHIIEDGWSRGFNLSQTMKEAAIMGHTVSDTYVKSEWERLQQEMETYVSAQGVAAVADISNL